MSNLEKIEFEIYKFQLFDIALWKMQVGYF